MIPSYVMPICNKIIFDYPSPRFVCYYVEEVFVINQEANKCTDFHPLGRPSYRA
jgi:hypothetical protein